jgi:hypothetical protein
MKIAFVAVATVVVLGTWLAGAAYSQKGAGDATGVARQAEKPEIISLYGKLLEIKTGPCEATTGQSPIGTHLILETAEKEKVNVHLGPAAAVAETAAKLTVGQEIAVKAFRTDKLKDQQYVAISLTFDKTTITLRDDTLRPVWAQCGKAGHGAGAAQGRGFGWGRGGWRWRGGQ